LGSILPQILVNSLITGSIYALAATGLAITFCSHRVLNFAHGHLIMLGGYLFYFFYQILALSIPGAITCTLLAAIPLGALIANLFIDPFVKINPILAFVTTLALSIILEAIISMIFGVNVLSLTTNFSLPFQFGNIFITTTQIFIITSALLIGAVIFFITKYTVFGARLRALNESPVALSSVGVNSKKIATNTFIISLGLAFIAGICLGFETNIQPMFGSSIMLKAFAAVVVGGLGNIRGAIFGAFLLAIIENMGVGLDLGSFSLPASYRDSFAFVIILIVLLIRPEGIFSTAIRST
jgi:branched-chain amino acid transport system permease protein